jgi:hypothetical protein
MIRTALIAAGALLLSAPQALAADKTEVGPGRHQACFYARDVNGFNAADSKTVYIRVGVKDVYRLDLFATCPDIDWDWKIGLVSRGSDWICDAMDATIIARSPIGPQRCEVNKVTKLTPAEVAALPRKQKP